MSYLAQRWRGGVIQEQQVVVGVQGQLVWIERAFGLTGRARQFFRQEAWGGEGGSGESHVLEQLATVGGRGHGRLRAGGEKAVRIA